MGGKAIVCIFDYDLVAGGVLAVYGYSSPLALVSVQAL